MSAGFGLSEQQMTFLWKCFSGVQPEMPAEKVRSSIWIFGSRARGDFKPYSDIDLLIDPDDDWPNSKILLIKERLEESSFPFKVDLVKISELADTHRASVLQDRLSVFKAF